LSVEIIPCFRFCLPKLLSSFSCSKHLSSCPYLQLLLFNLKTIQPGSWHVCFLNTCISLHIKVWVLVWWLERRFAVRLSGCEAWLCHAPVIWPWHGPCSLTNTAGIIIGPTPHWIMKHIQDFLFKCLKQHLGPRISEFII
jgi:hypothetical protein